MSENSPVPPINQPTDEQPTGVSHPKMESGSSNISLAKKRSLRQGFHATFAAQKLSDDEPHPLYKKYEPPAERVKITIQMLIGIILGLFLLMKVIANIFYVFGSPFLKPLALSQHQQVLASPLESCDPVVRLPRRHSQGDLYHQCH